MMIATSGHLSSGAKIGDNSMTVELRPPVETRLACVKVWHPTAGFNLKHPTWRGATQLSQPFAAFPVNAAP
jgi:hypothetical protein